jgi:hypothetical protein
MGDRIYNSVYNSTFCDEIMKRDLVKDMIQRKKRELIVAFIGYIIGIGIGVWFIIELIWMGISK